MNHKVEVADPCEDARKKAPPGRSQTGRAGSWERLRDDSITLIARMQLMGVDARLKIFDAI
jgi:hypothetical protein